MSSEPARLTVTEIRQKIYEVSDRPAEGAGRTAGALFHRAAACAVGVGHPAGWTSVLTATLDEDAWLHALYERIVGPELDRMHAELPDSGEQVLKVWTGVRQLVHWFCGLLREAIDADNLHYDEPRKRWICANSHFESEVAIDKTLVEPNWTRPVTVSGRLDQLIRTGPDRWCVVEFKLGGGHAEADGMQAALYHLMLGGTGEAAVVHFGEGESAEESVLSQADLERTRPAILALIGALAGVTRPGDSPAATTVPRAGLWPKKPSPQEVGIGDKLLETLREYGAEARLAGDPLVGPSFVRYLLQPMRGVTVSSIERRTAEIRVRLQLGNDPVIHRRDGHIAIDVQRPQREYVSFASLQAELAAQRHNGENSKVLVGVDLRGAVHFADLAGDCPHLLVGGQTGSGKTEWLRAAVASLMVTNTPETLRLVVIDPKKNAFPELAGSRFLLRADTLIDSPDAAVRKLLQELVVEISRRQELFKKIAVNDLAQYQSRTQERLPRILCIVDEFSEFLLSGPKKQRDEFEQYFVRIGQIGRSAGVHLMLATQRPERKTVSGSLKINLSGKIAMRVNDRISSGVLIDGPGAELLLGRGDLLFAGISIEPIRLQSAWLSEEERRAIFS